MKQAQKTVCLFMNKFHLYLLSPREKKRRMKSHTQNTIQCNPCVWHNLPRIKCPKNHWKKFLGTHFCVRLYVCSTCALQAQSFIYNEHDNMMNKHTYTLYFVFWTKEFRIRDTVAILATDVVLQPNDTK